MAVDRERLLTALEAEFGGNERGRRVVSRQAQDLADTGRIEADLGYELTADEILSNLGDAPDEYTLVERWNWWIGSLELSHGDYRRFRVRPDIENQ